MTDLGLAYTETLSNQFRYRATILSTSQPRGNLLGFSNVVFNRAISPAAIPTYRIDVMVFEQPKLQFTIILAHSVDVHIRRI